MPASGKATGAPPTWRRSNHEWKQQASLGPCHPFSSSACRGALVVGGEGRPGCNSLTRDVGQRRSFWQRDGHGVNAHLRNAASFMGVAQFSPWAMLYVRAIHGLEPHEALVVNLGESLGFWEVVVQFSPDNTPISTYMAATAKGEAAEQAAQPVPAQWVSADSMQQAARAAAAAKRVEQLDALLEADLAKFRSRPTKEAKAAKQAARAAAAEAKEAAKQAARAAAAEAKEAFRQRQAAFLEAFRQQQAEAFRQQQAEEKAAKRQRR